MKTNEQWDSKDKRLEFALNLCIDELDQIFLDLPRGASDEEITQAIKKLKACIGMLMTDVRRIECEIEGKPINLENMVGNFFDQIAKVRREA